jgi:hypothetical protein
MREKKSEAIIGTKDGFVRFVDIETGIERDKVGIAQDSVRNLELYLPPERFSLETLSTQYGDEIPMLLASSRNGIFLSQLHV